MTANPAAGQAGERPSQMGLAALARMVFERQDLAPLWARLIEQATGDLSDASAMLDLATLAILTGDRNGGLGLQEQALQRQQLFRRASPKAEAPSQIGRASCRERV